MSHLSNKSINQKNNNGHTRKNEFSLQHSKQNDTNKNYLLQLQKDIGNQSLIQLIDYELYGENNSKSQDKNNNLKEHSKVIEQMEKAFNCDFSDVKIFSNSNKATEVGALAYTSGNNIHFAPSEYNPSTKAGQELLGHEFAHIVQQRQGRVKPLKSLNGLSLNDDSMLEREADVMGAMVANMSSTSTTIDNNLSNTFTSSTPNDNIIQRKVGLEFQTVGGIRNVFDREDDGTYTKHEDHGTLLENCTGYNVTADGSDLEFVTDAFEETDSGRTSLGAAMNSIESYMTNLIGLGSSGKLIRNYKLKVNSETTAHPQATVGIKLDKIHELIRILSKPKPGPVPPGRTRGKITGFRETLGWGSYRHPYSRSHPDRPRKTEQRAPVKRAVSSAQSIQGEVANVSDELKGFLSLVGSYAQGANALLREVPNAKDGTPIMARTSLFEIFNKLSVEDKTTFRFLLTSDVSKLETLTGRSSLDEPLFNHGTGKNTDFTIRQWFTDIASTTDGKDRLAISPEHSMSEIDSIYDEWQHKYHMTRPTDIGLDTTTSEVDGAILELRALGRKVKPDKWKDVALAVFNLTRHLNETEDR